MANKTYKLNYKFRRLDFFTEELKFLPCRFKLIKTKWLLISI